VLFSLLSLCGTTLSTSGAFPDIHITSNQKTRNENEKRFKEVHMKKLKNYFNRKSSTGKQPPASQDHSKTKEEVMKTQTVQNNTLVSATVDFPAPGALTATIMVALLEMVSQCRGIARQAEEKGDLKTALAAIKETHRLLMDLAKIDAARLKAEQNQPAAKTTGKETAIPAPRAAPAPEPANPAQTAQAQPAAQVTPVRETDRGQVSQNVVATAAAVPEPPQVEAVQAVPQRQQLPPGARGITNLGNIVW
jgi:hypothetical protein